MRALRSADAASGRRAAAGSADAVILLLHGYGSSEHDLPGVIPALGLDLPWASLRAPVELPNGGAAWFEITTPGDPAPGPVNEATGAVWTWVDEHLDAATSVVPLGFSQGGLMATQLLRTRPERVLAPVVLGGFVGSAPQPADDDLARSRPAVFWGRGADDMVIAATAVARTAAWLSLHSSLDEHVYAGLGHGVSAEEIADVAAFLAGQTGARSTTRS